MTVKNCIRYEIKSRLNSGNKCYHSFKSLISSHVPSNNVKNKKVLDGGKYEGDFWDTAPCNFVEVYRRFTDDYCLCHRGFIFPLSFFACDLTHPPDDGGNMHLRNAG
jgi:hypothetical protein